MYCGSESKPDDDDYEGEVRILFGANPDSNDGMTPHSSPSTTLKDSLSLKRLGKRGLTRCVPLTAQTTQNTAPYATQQPVQRMIENAMCLVLFSKASGAPTGFQGGYTWFEN